MSNPNPIQIFPFKLFVELPVDIVATLLCRYLTIRDVEAMGTTCKAARERFQVLKRRPDFWNSLIHHERHLKRDWSRLPVAVSLEPPLPRADPGVIDIAMNGAGSYLFVRHYTEPQTLTAYRRTSESPLSFARGIVLPANKLQMVGMDNNEDDPGVYLWNKVTHELSVWHAQSGITLVASFPEYSELVAHSRYKVLFVSGIIGQQLVARQYQFADNGLIECENQNVSQELPHGYFLLKLSPGGQSMMCVDQRNYTLMVYNSRNLKPHTGCSISLATPQPVVFCLLDLSISDCGGTLFQSTPNTRRPSIISLDRVYFIERKPAGHHWDAAVHPGNGKFVLSLSNILNGDAEQAHQCFTTGQIVSGELEEAIREILQFAKCYAPESSNVTFFASLMRDAIMNQSHFIRPSLAHFRTVQDEMKGATPARLSAIYNEFFEMVQMKELLLYLPRLFDFANCLDLDDQQSPVKPVEPYWSSDLENQSMVTLLDRYQFQKKWDSKIRTIQRFCIPREDNPGSISFNHILLDLNRRIPNGPTLAEVITESRRASDRRFHKLIPKQLNKITKSDPLFRNYVILAALLKKIILWTDDEVKKAQLQKTRDAVVRAADHDPDLRFDRVSLLNSRFENCASVFECLQGTPYYKIMMKYFQVAELALEDHLSPSSFAC